MRVPTFSEEQWRRLGFAMYGALGASRGEIEPLVDVLVTGSLCGIDSHGVREYPRYVLDVQRGRVRLGAEMRVVREAQAVALLDAAHTFGFAAAKRAMEIAIEKAGVCGVGSCGILHCGHIGNLFHYLRMALGHDMVGVALCRGGTTVVPHGGTGRRTGTNPIGVSIPAGEERPIILDMATSSVAVGHVQTLALEGRPIPAGWMIDAEGNPVTGLLDTTDPGELLRRGCALLPFGSYKGYGINVAVEVLGGALSGSGTGRRGRGQGTLMAAIDVAAFIPVEEFKVEVDRLIRDIKSSPVRPGFKEVLLPGELELLTEERRKREGIPVDDWSWRLIEETCKKIGVDTIKAMS